MKAGAIAAAVIFAIGAIVASAGWYEAAKRAVELLAAKDALKGRVDELRAANMRLSRKIALKVAPTGGANYFVTPNWYQIASDYSGAIAFVRPKPGGTAVPPSLGTGFIVRGSTR